MSQSRQIRRRDEDEGAEPGPTQAQAQTQQSDDDFDALLDEIDGVLEVNAEEFVRSFVQKGGQ
ncbi:ubiquitin-like protein Pup [Naumannella sp. ID2617S]|uniref:Prokaryotic ubiquitin-like protein Pup n=1 Tax=Enemella dayhoffiae TaxID=2016507 RepID=A0A255H9F7_9ACTN|nr:ubiquitin-like protein Pup [Enemella dayhoffiae]NNG19139.1 ubiquitin-like protein Pup [Naumannella sp. ID2617S]OYO24261.1 ubiquitin-like protein Pup [Enemella dayhoffiae]